MDKVRSLIDEVVRAKDAVIRADSAHGRSAPAGALAAGASASARRSFVRCSATCARRWSPRKGAGLAAPQIGVRLARGHLRLRAQPALSGRRTGAVHGAGQSGHRRRSLDEMEDDWEGCLSVPGLRGIVPRFGRVRYSGFDPHGRPIDREASGFHARVVQHECDHLDGILYPMRMRDMRTLGFTERAVPGRGHAGRLGVGRPAPRGGFVTAAAGRRATSRASAARLRRAAARRRAGRRPRRARPGC